MQIKLDFDNMLLQEYEARNSPPFFLISFQHIDEFYPSENWTDFGGVILSWWICALVQLLRRGHREQFLFMDGPYEIEVCYRRKTGMMELRPEGLDVVWEVTPIELSDALVCAGETVVQKLIQVGTGVRIRKGLEQGLAELRQATQELEQISSDKGPKRFFLTTPATSLAVVANLS